MGRGALDGVLRGLWMGRGLWQGAGRHCPQQACPVLCVRPEQAAWPAQPSTFGTSGPHVPERRGRGGKDSGSARGGHESRAAEELEPLCVQRAACSGRLQQDPEHQHAILKAPKPGVSKATGPGFQEAPDPLLPLPPGRGVHLAAFPADLDEERSERYLSTQLPRGVFGGAEAPCTGLPSAPQVRPGLPTLSFLGLAARDLPRETDPVPARHPTLPASFPPRPHEGGCRAVAAPQQNHRRPPARCFLGPINRQ